MFIWKFVFFVSIWTSVPASSLTSNEISQDSSREETVYTCQNSVLDLSCGEGLVIQIIRANYGRLVKEVCDFDSNNVRAWSGNDCMADNSYYILDERCGQKQKCRVEATNRVFGDPCRGTIKYLEVQYDCVLPDSSVPKTVFSCEGSELELNCEKDRVLSIIRANYGRLASDVCENNKNNTNQCSENYCMAENSYSIVNDSCGDKQSCVVKASSSVFGDPCPGINKYLEVQYTCVQSETSGNLREGCPELPGWHDLDGDYCYFIETENKLSWYQAHFECMRRGGYLASLHSEEESVALHKLVKHAEYGVHIGLFRLMKDEDFVWADGTDLNYKNWNTREPNNVAEKCVEALSSHMKWNDAFCGVQRGYICSVWRGTQTSQS